MIKERQSLHVGVVVERLVQRLLCNVGTLDARFSSKFLVTLQSPHSQAVGKRLSFKYLVRLDALSTPALYPEQFEPPVKVMEGSGMDTLPQGYVKVRVHGEYLEQWSEFINPSGLLRRDKIQERFIELLARAAARPTEPSCPAHVDESRLCGSPGKIVDPVTLYHILKLPSSSHVFYGAAECNESRFPDPRDFRIAIVEGSPETRLHISFLSPTAQTLIGEGDVEIVLILGIGATGWPLSSDYPSRYPLDHVDVILSYQSAQMDYYVVPKGPPHAITCEDRNTLWEIRPLPTEMFLEYHYSPISAIGRIFKILWLLLELLRSRGIKTVNRYILKNLIFFELESKKRIEQWMPRSISRRVLYILDNLLAGLRNQALPSYFFKRKNLLLQDNTLEEDYVSDGDILEHYLRQLSQDGNWTDNNEGCYVTIKDQLENVMLQKWTNVVASLLPPISNRGRRLSVSANLAGVSYTRRQMEYVALLFREILKLKHIQQKQTGREFPSNGKPEDTTEQLGTTEEVVFLLQIVFGQAKQRICTEMASQISSKSCDANRKKFKLAQLLRSYDVSTSMLIDDFRRSKPNTRQEDDMNLVATVIECLYKATDSDGRVLGPILRPYLNQLFRGSHENCWFLPEWKKKVDDLEFQAIAAFSALVVSGDIDPVSGILDSANKGWNWAKNCIRIMQSIREENSASMIVGDKIDSSGSGLRLVFTPSSKETVRYTVALPGMVDVDFGEKFDDYSTVKSTRVRRRAKADYYATIRSFSGDLQTTSKFDFGASPSSFLTKPNRFPDAGNKGSPRSGFEKQPPHARLRDVNPFTFASMEARRQGSHRGLGSIVQALISLQKLTVLPHTTSETPAPIKYVKEEELTQRIFL
ncbi:UNVERIFIED_CONTAM: hypothetical protein PYX00_010387 [Menopon gallinae]|uniref:Mab-21-like HhH/H2TH-like domain-containing protein n=1 Tax=Menopon gallinae TaxID=328185 RepID=A0AAW2HFH9_9NEOP